jgi:hypothetical protein
MFDPFQNNGAISLHERKLAAWAIAVGEDRPTKFPGPSRRPHRGMLGDVDLSAGDAGGKRQSAIRRLITWFRNAGGIPREERNPATALSGGDGEGVPNRQSRPYIGSTGFGTPDDFGLLGAESAADASDERCGAKEPLKETKDVSLV